MFADDALLTLINLIASLPNLQSLKLLCYYLGAPDLSLQNHHAENLSNSLLSHLPSYITGTARLI